MICQGTKACDVKVLFDCHNKNGNYLEERWHQLLDLLIGKRKREVKIGKHNRCYNKTTKTLFNFIV